MCTQCGEKVCIHAFGPDIYFLNPEKRPRLFCLGLKNVVQSLAWFHFHLYVKKCVWSREGKYGILTLCFS